MRSSKFQTSHFRVLNSSKQRPSLSLRQDSSRRLMVSFYNSLLLVIVVCCTDKILKKRRYTIIMKSQKNVVEKKKKTFQWYASRMKISIRNKIAKSCEIRKGKKRIIRYFKPRDFDMDIFPWSSKGAIKCQRFARARCRAQGWKFVGIEDSSRPLFSPQLSLFYRLAGPAFRFVLLTRGRA